VDVSEKDGISDFIVTYQEMSKRAFINLL